MNTQPKSPTIANIGVNTKKVSDGPILYII